MFLSQITKYQSSRKGVIKIDINKLNEIFLELKTITGIQDIAYHKFEDGYLQPIYKLESDHLKSSDWKQSHSKLCIKIENDWVLQTVVNDQKTFYMPNVDEVSNAPKPLSSFGIKTLLLIPDIKDNQILGMVDIASIGKVVYLSPTQIHECEKLVSRINHTV